MGVTMRKPSARDRAVVLIATALAIALACVFFWGYKHPIVFDARGYYELSKIVDAKGLFGFSNELRTYGYPLFVALCALFTNHNERVVHGTVFGTQLLIHILLCYGLAKASRAAFRTPGFDTWLYVCTVLNPFLLIQTAELLTDLLSAVMIGFVLLLLLQAVLHRGLSEEPSTDLPERPSYRRSVLLAACLAAGFSVMVRPANISIVFALLVIWSIAAARAKRLTLAEFAVVAVGLSIPCVPQLVNNYRSFHRIQPLVVHGLAHEQLVAGALHLKYGTVVIGNQDPQLCYENPFLRPGIAKPIDFLRKRPLGYVLTLCVHAYALLDQDFPFTYIRDLHPWYRWPLSVLNDVFLAGVLYGTLIAIRRFARKRRLDRETFATLVIGIMSLSYLALYLPCRPENRYSLPLLLLWSPLFVIGLMRLRLLLASRCYLATMRVACGLVVFVGCCVWLSYWIQMQSPRLRQTLKGNRQHAVLRPTASVDSRSVYAGILSPRRTATADPSATNVEVGG